MKWDLYPERITFIRCLFLFPNVKCNIPPPKKKKIPAVYEIMWKEMLEPDGPEENMGYVLFVCDASRLLEGTPTHAAALRTLNWCYL
jgi:hypothetical protein